MQSFQRGKHELLVGGLSLVFVEGFAEFAVKRIDFSTLAAFTANSEASV